MSAKHENQIIQPYLFFNGVCDQAIEFYRQALGAEVQLLMRYHESPEPPPPGRLPPGFENKVMHASLRVGRTVLMMSDGCAAEKPVFQGFSLALSLPTAAEVDRVFAALAAGGKVTMPLAKTFWSERFGMAEDRFGLGWMVSVEPAEP
jgi:PhnB protein